MTKRFFDLFFIVLTLISSCSLPVSTALFKETTVASIESQKSTPCLQKHTQRVVLRKGDNVVVKLSKPNTIYEIKFDFDLKGSEVRIGSNSVLRFQGGSLRNCTLTGKNTRLEGGLINIFDNVHIKGTWIIQKITTEMWKSLNYPNSLEDVFALLNPEIQNKLVIENNGYDYYLVAGPKEGILTILDNTELVINCHIALQPNGYNGYEMIRISSCNNVIISGNGTIAGDRKQHDYTSFQGTHEFGHGFVIRASKNIDISGITMTDFTGDALCLMDNCSEVNIHDLTVKDCRRCAVSIRADHHITIENCIFSGIVNDKYNDPSAAIDIEPVVDCVVHDIVIKNCRFNNNARGISSNARNYYGGRYKKGDKTVTEGRRYVNLEINNCRFENSTYTAFIAPFGWEEVSIRNCSFYNGRQEDIRVGYTTKCIIENCQTSCDEDSRASRSRNFVTTFYDNKSIRVDGCSGDNIKRVFNDSKNCKLTKSEFNTNQ